MTLEEIREHINEDNGWCTVCRDVTQFGGVEPDAGNYRCPDCGNFTVFGMEEAAAVIMVVPLTAGDDDKDFAVAPLEDE